MECIPLIFIIYIIIIIFINGILFGIIELERFPKIFLKNNNYAFSQNHGV